MSVFEEQIAMTEPRSGEAAPVSKGDLSEVPPAGDEVAVKPAAREWPAVVATFLTTLGCFGVFFIQGMIIARILGPLGRGEFGSAIYFPRDIFLYAGLLGGIEIVNAYAKRGSADPKLLKQSAASLGLISGALTGAVAAIASVIMFTLIPGKSYLIPVCLLCCLFVPFEHMHLNISAVDRGKEAYARYNVNRLIFALAFPILVLLVFGFDELTNGALTFYSGFNSFLPLSTLAIMCGLFVMSKLVGLVPTLRDMDFAGYAKKPFRKIQQRNSPHGEASDQAVPNASKLLVDGRPYAFSTFATELFERLDIFLILALASIQESGFYFVAVPAATLLTVAPNALGVFTFNAGAENRKVTLSKAMSVIAGTVALQIVTTLVFMLIIPSLIVWVYSSAYEAAVPFALWLLPACAIKGFLQAADGYLKGRGKPMIGVWARIGSIFIMLVWVWLAYPRFGLISIPMAACVGQVVSMIVITTAVIRDVISQNPPAIRGEMA